MKRIKQISTFLMAVTFAHTLFAKTAQVNHVPATTDVHHAQTNHPKAHPAAGLHEDNGIDAQTGLRYLRNGNKRFVRGFFRKDGASHADVKRLAAGQKPHSIIVACSDSRVPPEVLFDQKLGEVFVVRTAGETLDPTSLASVEYALEHLGTKNVVVLGHTNCGAVKAAFSTLDGQDAGSENLNKLVQDIHPRIKKFKGKTPSRDYAQETTANAEGVAKDLMTRSKIISEKVKSSGVIITPAVYDLHTGEVEFKH